MFYPFWEMRLRLWQWGLIALLLCGADVFLGFRFGWLLAVGLLLVVALIAAWQGWRAAARYRVLSQQREHQSQEASIEAGEALLAAQERLRQTEARRTEEQRRLRLVMNLHRQLAKAENEHDLMNSALAELTALVGALGCSFVPVDEWNQPLPAFTYGQLPEPVLRAWAEHLASNMLRERCGNCRLLVGPPGGCPLHPPEVGGALRVYCIPLDRLDESPRQNARLRGVDPNGDDACSNDMQHSLGVLHLYMPPGRVIDADLRAFLERLVQEIAFAYENTRLRSQEFSTLQQIQRLHGSESDFIASLSSLLDGLKQALEADCLLIRLRPSVDERFSNLSVLSGDPCGLDEEHLEAIFTGVVASALRMARIERESGAVASTSGSERLYGAASAPGEVPVWIALPMLLPEPPRRHSQTRAGHVLGMLLVGSNHPQAFHPRQKAILQTVAAQAALLIENERMIRSLEYKVVIQERARLAREIHDGLAQTLAYLKLQASQMQNYLTQGDMARLGQVLKDNYQVLTEAYLDTRQAIDNLRLTPDEGMGRSLAHIVDDFEKTARLQVERKIEPLTHPVSPEVQAHLVRIVQEALSNIRKHARADQVWVNMREWQGQLIVEVTDDGVGFDAGDVPELSRHGLRGMRERAEMIGADFQMISQARHGTTMRLALPISLEEESSR